MSLSHVGDSASAQSYNNTNKVVDQLGMAIVSGDYAERTMIPLDPDLEEMFAVSRTVIREAKKTLVAKGLLQSKAKVGTRVRPSSEWNMFDSDVLRWHASLRKPGRFWQELFEIRLIVEPPAAASVANRAGPDDIRTVEQHCNKILLARDRRSYAIASAEFHKTILQLSDNRFLSSLGDMVQASLYSMLNRHEEQGWRTWREQDRANADLEYQRVFDAIAAAQPRRAQDALAHAIAMEKQELF